MELNYPSLGAGAKGNQPRAQSVFEKWFAGSTGDPLFRPATYVFSSVVGTSRCDVRAACSGATPSNASSARSFVPPATTRAGTAQRAIPTTTLNTCPGKQDEACSSRGMLSTLRRGPEGKQSDLQHLRAVAGVEP